MPEVANQQQSKTDQTARLQLAIQHKPTTKPMVTPSSPSSGQSATSFQALLEKIGTKPTPSSNNITAKRTFESTGSRTKRVRFAQDPVSRSMKLHEITHMLHITTPMESLINVLFVYCLTTVGANHVLFSRNAYR